VSAGARENTYVRAPGYAARYRDLRFARASGPRTHAREMAAIAHCLAAAGDLHGPWLDMPCGTGRASGLLPQPVVQVDRDLAMLRAIEGPAASRVCASGLRLPFADATFHGVLCLRLLQHLPLDARRTVLAELARVARSYVLFSYFDARTVQHWRRVVRRALGKTRSGRVAVAWPQLRAELTELRLRVLARRALLPWLSEQTLVLVQRQ
jgi:SAM-dependent methyltransferase